MKTARNLLLVLTTLTALVVALLPASSQAAPSPQKSDYATAPGYESSRLHVKVLGKPKAGQRARVKVRGTNQAQTPGYALSVYVADRNVFKKCPFSFSDMRNNLINNPDAVASIVSETNIGTGERFAKVITYRTGGTRKVLYCAYVRWIVDDVSVSGLRHTFRKR